MLSNNEGFGKKIYLKIMGLKEWKPHFERKFGDEIQTFTQVEGDFKEITFKDITWSDNGKEKVRRVFDLTLFDGDEEYHIGSWFTQVGRSLLNTLISKDKHWRLLLSLYQSKTGYPSISVYTKDKGTMDQPLRWKLSTDEQKALTKEVTVNGDTVYDRAELDALLEKEAMLLTSINLDLWDDFDFTNWKSMDKELAKPAPTLKKELLEDEDLPF